MDRQQARGISLLQWPQVASIAKASRQAIRRLESKGGPSRRQNTSAVERQIFRSALLAALPVLLSLLGTSTALSTTANSCNRVSAQRDMQEAKVAFSHRQYRNSRKFALNAAVIYGKCGTGEQEPAVSQDALHLANASLLVGASSLQLHLPQAKTDLAMAYRLFNALRIDPATPSSIASQARSEMARLIAIDPSLKYVRIPTLAVASPATDRSPLDVRPMAAWRSVLVNSSTDDRKIYIHVRVHLTARAQVYVTPDEFHITAFSSTAGQETFPGLDQTSPSYQKYDYTTNPPTYRWVPTISADEDLGAMGGLNLSPGDERTVVVTFAVRDGDASSDDQARSAGSTIVFRARPR